MKTDAAEFVGLLFLSRDFAHSAHLNTDSYSQHMALGAFYDDIVDAADRFAEAYMGRYGKKIGDVPVLKTPTGEPLAVLKRHLSVVEETRDFIPSSDTPLNNIIDEIVAIYLSAIYKLTFLK